MLYTYTPKKTCARQIQFEINDGKLSNVQFVGGCNGNLKGIASLVEGMPWREVIQRLSGIHCGLKDTSCPDQLSKAIQEAMKE